MSEASLLPIYLPIAEMPLDALLLLGMGGAVGFLSGLFGVGGGFLLTPLLIVLGVPSAVAAASQAPQQLATSLSGGMAHFRRGSIDFQMGGLLLAGGIAGSVAGVLLVGWLRAVGQFDLVISLAYLLFLGTVGSLMLIEASRAILRRGVAKRRKLHTHLWLHDLPWKMRFRKSRLYISALPPLIIGLVGGMLVSVMGIGGGLVLVPAMIFILGMPTLLAMGTSLFEIVFVTAGVTVLHSYANQSVDAVLALLLGAGGVVGAQWGARLGPLFKAEHLRGLFAILVLGVAIKVAADLTIEPIDLYTLTNLRR